MDNSNNIVAAADANYNKKEDDYGSARLVFANGQFLVSAFDVAFYDDFQLDLNVPRGNLDKSDLHASSNLDKIIQGTANI